MHCVVNFIKRTFFMIKLLMYFCLSCMILGVRIGVYTGHLLHRIYLFDNTLSIGS